MIGFNLNAQYEMQKVHVQRVVSLVVGDVKSDRYQEGN